MLDTNLHGKNRKMDSVDTEVRLASPAVVILIGLAKQKQLSEKY
jgi:hypothetical protein